MKIAVDVRRLMQERPDNMGSFIYEVFKRITQEKSEHEFLFLFDEKPSDEFLFSSNIQPIILSPKVKNSLTHVMYQKRISKALRENKANTFISPEIFLGKVDLSTVAIVPSLHSDHYSHILKYVAKKYNELFDYFLKSVKRIATMSEFTKKHITELYDVNTNVIDVVSNGPDHFYKPLDEEDKAEIRNKYAKGFQYFIFINDGHKEKALLNLLKAYEHFRYSNDSDIKLLIEGSLKYYDMELKEFLKSMQFREDVVFIDMPEKEELVKIHSSALAAFYIPVFDGFSIPILNCFMSETAIITSNVGSLSCIVGDAGLVVDPYAEVSIASAMKEIYESSQIRQKLVRNGKLQRQEYTWEKTASKLWNCIENAVV